MNFEQQIRRLQGDIVQLGMVVANTQRDAVRQTLRQTVLPEMRAAAPVKTGATRRALTVHSPKSSLGRTMSLEVRDMEANGSNPRWYAPREDARRPWFTRIWARHEPRLAEHIAKHLNRSIERERRRILASSQR